MTTKEMQADLLRRYYENTLELAEQAETAKEKQEILHDAATVFCVSCERIPRKE